jgi:hypothetical protein
MSSAYSMVMISTAASATDYSYMGFTYTDGSSNVYYGYVQYVSYSNSGTATMTLIGYAMESDASTGITVVDLTAVPEPASASLMLGSTVLLAVGAGYIRKRKKND